MTARIWVVCPDFVSGPHGSQEIADRHLRGVLAAGMCHEAHEIIVAEVKPRTRRETEDTESWVDD